MTQAPTRFAGGSKANHRSRVKSELLLTNEDGATFTGRGDTDGKANEAPALKLYERPRRPMMRRATGSEAVEKPAGD